MIQEITPAIERFMERGSIQLPSMTLSNLFSHLFYQFFTSPTYASGLINKLFCYPTSADKIASHKHLIILV